MAGVKIQGRREEAGGLGCGRSDRATWLTKKVIAELQAKLNVNVL